MKKVPRERGRIVEDYTISVLKGFKRANSWEGVNQVPNINLTAASSASHFWRQERPGSHCWMPWTLQWRLIPPAPVLEGKSQNQNWDKKKTKENKIWVNQHTLYRSCLDSSAMAEARSALWEHLPSRNRKSDGKTRPLTGKKFLARRLGSRHGSESVAWIEHRITQNHSYWKAPREVMESKVLCRHWLAKACYPGPHPVMAWTPPRMEAPQTLWHWSSV